MKGIKIFFIEADIPVEMSESAIQNLSESLDLIQSTIEAILQSEARAKRKISAAILHFIILFSFG